jgi:hypothetical protein
VAAAAGARLVLSVLTCYHLLLLHPLLMLLLHCQPLSLQLHQQHQQQHLQLL